MGYQLKNRQTYPPVLKLFKEPVSTYKCGFQIMKKSKNLPENHQFFAGSFMKTIRFWGRTGTSQFFDSDFLKGKKEPEVLCFVEYFNEPAVL
jgi:hypothetical protein